MRCEEHPLLSKVIVGSADVDLAGLIEALEHGDWVKAGLSHLERTDGSCPFCQQPVPDKLRSDLDAFFGGSYQADIEALADLVADYKRHDAALRQSLDDLAERGTPRLDAALFEAHRQAIVSVLDENHATLLTKQGAPGQKVTLKSIGDVVTPLADLITEANAAIKQHNALVDNRHEETRELTDQVWRHLIDGPLKNSLDKHKAEVESLNKAIDGITTKQVTAEKEQNRLKAELAALERKVTGVVPTMTAINDLLEAYGFDTFRLAEATGSSNAYELRRPDGTACGDTLSDGEQTFVTLLYFYHLVCNGSHESDAVTTPRVVVFDDPVSSVDGDTLFVISHLIQDVIKRVRESSDSQSQDGGGETGEVTQVFVLTHNVYFHKQVAFHTKRQKGKAFKDETFWVVRRVNTMSTIEQHDRNPVRDSYGLLWDDVRDQQRSANQLCNTLRRILETYFKMFGSVDLRTLEDKFDGSERVLCASLLSWAHDGSHAAMDDLHAAQSPDARVRYLAVFRKIFEKHNHLAHYKMMMGDNADKCGTE